MKSTVYTLDINSHSVVSNSLRPHGLQHARLPCPSPTPRACSNSWPSSRWCHPAISSSVIPFSSRLQSFPASGLRIRWPKYWSFSFNISSSNEYPGLILFSIDWFDLLAVQGTLKSLLQHHSSKASNSQCMQHQRKGLAMTPQSNVLLKWLGRQHAGAPPQAHSLH